MIAESLITWLCRLAGAGLVAACGWFVLFGYGGGSGEAEIVWGRRGVRAGDLVKPRAAAIDARDRLFLVDFTARIQVYDRDGQYRGPSWTTPDYRNGRPSGLSIDRDGNLLVSDSHYHCLRIYNHDGQLLRTIGGSPGSEPGQFGYISDAEQDSEGNFYVAEFGINERITKLDPDGKFLLCWGSRGTNPGQFATIRSLAWGPDGYLYVADACNHRVQVFTKNGQLVRVIGRPGENLGELKYPYDLAFSSKGVLYVVEYGNHRVQKFTPDGKSLGWWGGPGGEPGQLRSPWALAIDSHDCIHVIDSENHRVQRIAF
ncbi:MAG: NHL repeat-containing protein [Gemmataceae bacterium]